MALVPSRVSILGRNLHQMIFVRSLLGCRSRCSAITLDLKRSNQPQPLCSFHTQQTFSSKKAKIMQPPIPARERRVILIGEDGSTLDTNKAKADSIARDKELRLVLVDDKVSPPVYKLMTGQDLHEERLRVREIKKAHKKKEPKSIRMTSRISPNDLATKTNHIKEWLNKGHEVKVNVKINQEKGKKAGLDILRSITQATDGVAHVNQAKNSETELIYNIKPIDNDYAQGDNAPKLLTNDELKAMKNAKGRT